MCKMGLMTSATSATSASKPKQSPAKKDFVQVHQVKAGRIGKPFKFIVKKKYPRGQISRNGKSYCKFLLSNGKQSCLEALSFEEFGERNYDKLEEGSEYIVADYGIEVVPLTKKELSDKKKYKSESTKQYKVYFKKDLCIQMTDPNPTVQYRQLSCFNVRQTMKNVVAVLHNVKLRSGTPYLYFGCADCTTSIKMPDENGRFVCKNEACKKYNPKTKSGETERKVCMIIKNMSFEDDSGVLNQVICYTQECERFLNNNAWDLLDFDVNVMFPTLLSATYTIHIEKMNGKSDLKLQHLEQTSPPESAEAHGGLSSRQSQPTAELEDVYDDVSIDFPKTLKLDFSEQRNNTLNKNIPRIESLGNAPYKLSSQPAGYALIINNDFPGTKSAISGTDIDEHNITGVLPHLGYELFKPVFKNIGSWELVKVLEEFKTFLIAKKAQSCIVVIMSHGTINRISMDDNKSINLYDDLVYKFSEGNFPEFIGKPKLFIVEACRGFKIETAKPQLFDETRGYQSHTLIIFATIPGHASYQEPNMGSVFLAVLANVFYKLANKKSIEQMLPIVQKMVRQYYEKRSFKELPPVQLPCWYNMLFETFYFQRNY